MKRIRIAAITLTSLALLAATAPTQAASATDAFLVFKTQAPGLAVTGETLDAAFPGAIEVKEFSYGVENPATIGSTGGGAGAGKAKFNNFIIKKTVDKASPPLMQALVQGAHFDEVTLNIRKAGGPVAGAPKTAPSYLVIKFKLVFVTKINVIKGDDAPEEQVTLAYGAMSVQYSVQDRTGMMQPTKPFQWNQITNTTDIEKLVP